MLGLGDLKKTRFYQDAFAEGKNVGEEEGKLEIVRRMIGTEFSLEMIAYFVDLPLEVVRQVAEETNRNES